MGDEEFAASFKEVLEERTRNVEWEVAVKTDGWDRAATITATVEVGGKSYELRQYQPLERVYELAEGAGMLAEQVLIDITLSWLMRRLETEVFCCVYPYKTKEERDGKRD